MGKKRAVNSTSTRPRLPAAFPRLWSRDYALSNYDYGRVANRASNKLVAILMCIGLILGVLISHAQPVHAEPIICDLEGGVLTCDLTTPTATATPTQAAPTATPTSTMTAVISPTSSPTNTPTAVTPTSTPLTKRFPPNGADGRITITQAGVYSGVASCGAITGGDYCLNINASPVTLQDFSVIALSAYGSILTTSNATFLRGTITGRGGITGYRVQNVLIDGVTFTVSVGAIGIYDQGEGCEALATKRTRFVTIRNSVVVNTSTANESLWFKCVSDLTIENNRLTSRTQWNVSLPDTTDAIIRGNTFDLAGAPWPWLAIELPKSTRVTVTQNTVTGQVGDTLVYVNSGTSQLTITDNCLGSGINAISLVHQPVVPGLVSARNGACVTPPSTGDAGLR
jgi:hypothetical protein